MYFRAYLWNNRFGGSPLEVVVMSETKEVVEETPKKKKKGKLPILVALVAILGGGGFFVMKGKGGKPQEPELKLGAIEAIDPEFLVNLSNGSTYLRTQVALQFTDTFKKEDLTANMAAVQDAIAGILSSKSPSSVRTLEGKRKLKIHIASQVNKILKPGEDHSKEEESGKSGKKSEKESKPNERDDWDSQTGPCLKVYFTGFVTQ